MPYERKLNKFVIPM